MPVKKASQPKPGLQRTAFLRAIASKDGVTHEHALQLAGLAPASGFTLGSTAAPPFGYPSSSPTAGPSRSRLADVKGKGKSASPIEISDSEDDRDGGRGGWTSSAAADDGVAASYQPHVCSRTKCAGNPNCLQYLGQEKWTVNTEKARDLFLRAALPGGNPLNLAREPGAPCGLRLGATCYANALLQTWYHNDDFRQIVYSIKPSATDKAGLRSTPLYQLQTVFHGLEASCQSHFDPRGLIETLQLEQGEQQDAQEFSKLFLDLISKSVPTLPDATSQNIVEAQFGGGLKYVTKCRICKYESRRESTFTELDLTIESDKDVDHLLAQLLKHELMSGDNKYDCPRCKRHRDAMRYTEIKSLPPTLNLSLLRFIYDAEVGDRVKTKKVVRFPPSIDMRPYVTGGAEQGELMFDLRAVLVHKGESADSGHYCAQVYNTLDDVWYECDDETVLNITPLTPPARKGPTKPESMAAPTFGSRCPVSEPHRSPRTAVSKLPSSGQFPDAGLSISPSSPIQPTNTEAALNKLLQASSSSPLKKSSKSDIPPWVTPQERSEGPISLDGTTNNSDDSDLELRPQPSWWKPSWSQSVPEHEHALAARSPPQLIQDCFSSSATISHAEGGFSQRTHGSGRVSSKKVSSLEKSRDLQASKDAYMLVYQRRLPSDAMDVERSEAPAYVRKDIERRNLAWSTACQLWELKEEVALEAFKEILEAKKAIFDKWEVDSFDETAYILETADLTAWVDQGLWEKSPKKGDSKMEARPSDTSKEDCNRSTGCLDRSRPDCGPTVEPVASLVELTTPTNDLDLFALPPEQVTPGRLADESAVETAREAYKRRLRASALARPLGGGTICSHGKIRSLLPEALSIKRVSSIAVDRLVRLGCTLEPGVERISSTSLCLECARGYYLAKTIRRQNEEIVATFKELDDDPAHGFWMSRVWWRDFGGQKGKGSAGIADPTDDQYQPHVFCKHGELATDRSARRLVNSDAFRFLQTIFEGLMAPDNTSAECGICTLGLRPGLEKAEEEKRLLAKLHKRAIDHAGHKEKSLVLGALAMVDRDFLESWYRWTKAPASWARPTTIATQQFICPHDKLVFDLANPRDFADPSFAFVQVREWEILSTVYDHGPAILVEYEETYLIDPWEAGMGTCQMCRRARLRKTPEGPIDVIVVDSPEAIASAAEQRTASLLTGRTAAGGRKSKRKRGKKKAKDEVIEVIIEPGDTVKDVKVSLAGLLGTSVLYLALYKDQKELDDASKSIREVDIVVGDCLFVVRQGDIDEDEQEQLAISGVSVKTARRLAATDRGAGFGGTLLTGGHGAGSKPTSGSAASMLGSEPPEQSGQSAGATRGGRSLMAIAADLEAGADVTAAEMNAISRSLGSNDLVKDKSLACERCTFVNEPGAATCAMCEAAL